MPWYIYLGAMTLLMCTFGPMLWYGVRVFNYMVENKPQNYREVSFWGDLSLGLQYGCIFHALEWIFTKFTLPFFYSICKEQNPGPRQDAYALKAARLCYGTFFKMWLVYQQWTIMNDGGYLPPHFGGTNY